MWLDLQVKSNFPRLHKNTISIVHTNLVQRLLAKRIRMRWYLHRSNITRLLSTFLVFLNFQSRVLLQINCTHTIHKCLTGFYISSSRSALKHNGCKTFECSTPIAGFRCWDDGRRHHSYGLGRTFWQCFRPGNCFDSGGIQRRCWGWYVFPKSNKRDRELISNSVSTELMCFLTEIDLIASKGIS